MLTTSRTRLLSGLAATALAAGVSAGIAQPAAADDASVDTAVPMCQSYFLYDPTGPSLTPRGGAALCHPSAPGTRVRVAVACARTADTPPDIRVFGPWVAQDGRTTSEAWCPRSYVAVDTDYEVV